MDTSRTWVGAFNHEFMPEESSEAIPQAMHQFLKGLTRNENDCGTILVRGQRARFNDNERETAKTPRMCYSYDDLVVEFGLLGGMDLAGETRNQEAAEEAIDYLMKGKGLFEGQPGRQLSSGVYDPVWSRGNHHGDPVNVGRLLVLETHMGRFLIGVSDPNIWIGKQNPRDFLLLAVARVLAEMFPADHELTRSYNWVERNVARSQRCVSAANQVKRGVDAVFSARPAYLKEHFAALRERRRRHMLGDCPFCKMGSASG